MKYSEYDHARFAIWALPHPLVLHWIINPGLAFNELVLGQRMPKVLLIEKNDDKPLIERSYVPCPHCGSMHDGRLWAKGNAFGHWFGYVCPACEKIIPCLWNIFSLLLLAITLPIWFLPARLLRPKWIEFEKKRLKRSQPLIQARNINWVVRGLFFGGAMWLVMAVLPYFFQMSKGHDPAQDRMWIHLPIWILAGLLWGLFMRFWMNRKGKSGSGAVTN